HGDGQPPGPLHPHHHHHRHHYHYSHRGPYRPDLAADGGAGEPLLPFLSSSAIEAASHYRHAHRHAQRPPSASTASEASHGAGPFVLMPGDVELYFVRRGTVLVEEGQRPEGLYFVVDGLLDVTARRWDSQGRGPGAGTDDDSGGGGMPLAAMTKRMGELAKQASDELHARGRGSGGKQGGPRAATTAAARAHAPAQRRSAPQPGSAGLGPRTPPGPAGRPRSLFVVRPGGLAGYLPAVTDLEAHVQVAALTDGV
ncbi:Nte1p, partial [Spiromyces aspiralis]